MNLTEEKGKLQEEIETSKQKVLTWKFNLINAKKKLKTIEKLIAKANETIGDKGVS